MTDAPQPEQPPKKKRPMTEAQRQALARGQEALRQRRAAKAAAASIDDVVRRHVERDNDPPHPDGFGGTDTESHYDQPPPIEEVARATEFVTGDSNDPIPPAESNYDHRVAPTFEVVDLAGYEYTPRNLADLMSCAPVGDGQYTILVERKYPKTYEGLHCVGIQPAITRYMTQEDFARFYGGGEYVLTLYGPPKRGGVYDPETRRIRPKPLSAPVKLTVPISSYGGPVVHEAEDDDHQGNGNGMRYGTAFSKRPASSAEARIVERQIQHDEWREERREDREKRERERERELAKEADERGITVAQLLAEQKDKELERTERAHQREIELMRERDRERERERERMERVEHQMRQRESLDMQGLAQVIQAVKPADNGKATEAELKRISESYRQDIDRLTTTHQREMQRMEDRIREVTERADQRVREAEDRAGRERAEIERRAEERIKYAEQRAEERMRETNERCEKRVREIEDQTRRTVEDVRGQAQQRLDDERRNHDRDLRSKEEAFNMRLETVKTSYETRIAAKDEEMARLRSEADRWRGEADKSKDIVGRVKELKETAEMLGMQEGGAPEEELDIKQMLFRVGMGMIEKGPEMIREAGQALRGANRMTPEQAEVLRQQQYQQMVDGTEQTAPRSMQPLPPRLRGRTAPVMQSAPMAFATEDGPDLPPMPNMQQPIAEPRYPAGYGGEMPPGSIPTQMPEPQMSVSSPPPVSPEKVAPAAAPPGPPMQQQAAPQQGAQPQPVQAVAISPQDILQFKGVAEAALSMGAAPDHFAKEMIEVYGVDRVRTIMASLTPERVIAVVQASQGGATSPLVRRDGQKFLRELWQALKQRTGG